MGTVNRAIVAGPIHRIDKLAKSGTGQDVINLVVRTEETRQERGTGNPIKSKAYHRVTCYGPLAIEVAALKLRDVIYVDGKFHHQYRKVQGLDQHSVDIIAQDVQLMSAANA